MIIAVDFDGTCVEHLYPDLGPDVPGAVRYLRIFSELGAKLILWTMRSPVAIPDGNKPFDDAVGWFKQHNIPLFGVNNNPDQLGWTSSPKAYAHLYIDDAAFGCPLRDGIKGDCPMVDWYQVGPDVVRRIEVHKATRGRK